MTAQSSLVSSPRFKPYPAYKDSGVEWLGEIPAHWEVVAVERRAKRIQTGTIPPTAETEYYEDGVVAQYEPGSFADDSPRCNLRPSTLERRQ